MHRLSTTLRGSARTSLATAFCTHLVACGADAPQLDDEQHQEVPPVVSGKCVHDDVEAPDYLLEIGCTDDFELLASEPLDASIPGARSVKVVLDQENGNRLYFQNSQRYLIHHDFAFEVLNTAENPVPDRASFNITEYFDSERRFILGAVTHYEGPDRWALELAPYDRADAAMVAKLHVAVTDSTYFGAALSFHPQSLYQESQVDDLGGMLVVTTGALYEGIDYQPLNLGSGMGRLRFMTADQLETEYVSYQDIVVLDRVPNDIAVVAGIITEEFQTPLSHVNVLSQNRHTPNMGLREATTNAELRALEGKWVHLTVGAFEYQVEEVSRDVAQQAIEDKKPDPAVVTPYDTSTTGLLDIETIVVPEPDQPLREAISAAVPIVGGKAAHFSWLAQIGDDVPVPKAFAIPAYYYDQFMTENGFDQQVANMLADPDFIDDLSERDRQLAELRHAMMGGVVNAQFQNLLREKLAADFPSEPTMRFRSSTNAEDLEGFTGAGLYTSKTGEVADWPDVLDAIREVWSSVWYYRAFDEREYRSIRHQDVAMALLVHHNFPEEESNGVAITNNPFDTEGLNPAFYINVQVGDFSVVQPDAGTTTDQLVYYYDVPNTPIQYITSSNLVGTGEHVLTARQVNTLGRALSAIHDAFSPAYGPASGENDTGWYAMDTEFKFDDRGGGGEPQLFMKQARPYPGRGE